MRTEGVAKVAARRGPRFFRSFRAGILALLAGPASAAGSFEPAGSLVRSGEDVLHVVCIGQGLPAVLLEAGAGGNHLDWSLAQPEIAREHRVCSYDRAGMGWSARSERPRTVGNIAGELRRALTASGVPRPFIMVGHSFGGLIALHYARRHPEEVAGLVLLDPTHPDQFRRFASAGVALPDPRLAVLQTARAAATLGLPEGLHGLALHLAGRYEARRSTMAEMVLLPANADAVRAGGMPLMAARILLHGNREWDGLFPDGRMEKAWADMQAELAGELGAPPPTLAALSGHHIALDRPDLVATAIREVMADGATASFP